MNKNTGYRQMLRDRCPKIVSHALKWCGAKEAWLDHVYKHWIWMYKDNKERLKATKHVLGYRNNANKAEFRNSRVFCFTDTIDWDNLSIEEIDEWKKVDQTVSWFTKKYAYIENGYKISKESGKDIKTIKLEIMQGYLLSMCPTKTDSEEVKTEKNIKINKFVDFLIDCFENRV